MAQANPTCPVCEHGTLRPSTYVAEIGHGEQRLRVSDLECYECADCGADPVFPDQARRNHRRYQDARRRADGLLTGEEIACIREKLGLTQRQSAALFGGGTNAFSKYERGDVTQSVAMDRLMRMLDAHPDYLAELQAQAKRAPLDIPAKAAPAHS
ncbi:MAG: type II toxin-antitoxin system MqsA family antitoxin [Gammaproteobacteria bacterium HGW-Gammaproteobacteria-8]|nr:MAG: type II toxin-antitoxin system MqsA family antitoxin [Gammaproteobacteria bacterium HGW-Gammaproteobacteria-8]